MTWTEFCDHTIPGEYYKWTRSPRLYSRVAHHLSTQPRILVSNMITVKERLKLCLMPTYRPRMVRNKGAILVLVFNFLIMNALALLSIYSYHNNIGLIAGVVGMSLIIPLAGWLADVRIGRFKVIYGSVLIMWSASVLLTLSAVLAKFINVYDMANEKIMTVLLVVLAIGLGAYLTSIVQFGLDQLSDASTLELKSFIIWYVCTFLSGSTLMFFFSSCVNEQYRIFLILLSCFCLSLALVLLLLCHQWLTKEPVTRNPLKLIYKVIKYAINTKRPQQRSAFTYCEDELPSRMDFGKMKYGGPFTTEQVEDVKTIMRITPFLPIIGALAGGYVVVNYYTDKFVGLVTLKIITITQYQQYICYSKEFISDCYLEATYTNASSMYFLLLVVLNETFTYPLCHRCVAKIESLHKILIGVLLQVTRIIVLMVYNVFSRQDFIMESNMNETIGCLFQASHGVLHNNFSYQLIVLPNVINCVSMLLIYYGAIEFLAAQVPYSMKGLMIGLCYYFLLLSTGAWMVITIPFSQYSSLWGSGVISCGFWFLILAVVLQIIFFFTLLMFKMRYKKRKREDVLPNEHIFAEDFYSKHIN